MREYWVVSAAHETITRFNLEGDGIYGRPLIFVNDERMASEIFPDFEVQLSEVFPIPEGEAQTL